MPKIKTKNRPELLLPAGNLAKLKTAILFGADAVYVGGKGLSLRAPAEMDLSELSSAVALCRKSKVKIYLAANLFPHQNDLKTVKKQLKKFLPLKFDAVLVSDPGLLLIIKKLSPQTKLHLSVQANTLNSQSVNFWKKQGVKRIVLARELQFEEIKAIRKLCPDIELEVFVHGALCLSYSGRCYLSQYLNERNANQGACSYPCRWKYYLREEDPSRELVIEEDARGVHLLNIRDLCLAPYLYDLIKIGINSFKIEGRMKSEFYVGTVGRIYRQIMDAYPHEFKKEWLNELKKVSNRAYSTGFFRGKPGKDQMRFDSSQYVKPYRFVGIVIGSNKKTITIKVKDHIRLKDKIEVIDPKIDKVHFFKINSMYSDKKGAVQKVGAGYTITVEAPYNISEGSLLRVKN